MSKQVKIKLLTDGGFECLRKVTFPVVVQAVLTGVGADVKGTTLEGLNWVNLTQLKLAMEESDEDTLYFSDGTSGLFGKEFELED